MTWRFAGDFEQNNPRSGVVFRSLSVQSFWSIFTFHDATANSFEDYMGEAWSALRQSKSRRSNQFPRVGK